MTEHSSPVTSDLQDFIQRGILSFKEHELRKIVETFCKLLGTPPQPATPTGGEGEINFDDPKASAVMGAVRNHTHDHTSAYAITRDVLAAIARCSAGSASAITQIDLGSISRYEEHSGESFEPDDEALIFLNNDNEQTCHVEGPNAKAMAAQIVAAVRANGVAQGCGDPNCKDPDCTYGKGPQRCQNCGQPISEIYCGTCREVGCSIPSTEGK